MFLQQWFPQVVFRCNEVIEWMVTSQNVCCHPNSCSVDINQTVTGPSLWACSRVPHDRKYKKFMNIIYPEVLSINWLHCMKSYIASHFYTLRKVRVVCLLKLEKYLENIFVYQFNSTGWLYNMIHNLKYTLLSVSTNPVWIEIFKYLLQLSSFFTIALFRKKVNASFHHTSKREYGYYFLLPFEKKINV